MCYNSKMKDGNIMYQRFKACLIQPSKIADYIKEPKKHTIIYTSLLLFIYILPLVLLAVVANPYPSVVTELFTNALIEENKIDYEIKDGVLVKTTDAATPECLDVVIDKERGLSIFIIFDDSGSEFTKHISSENKRSFAVVFNKESVDLMRIVKTTETTLKDKVYNKSNDSELDVVLYKANPVASLTYAELGCTNLSFSLSSYENETDFRFTISKAVNKAFEFINPILVPFIMIMVALTGIAMYFFSVLFIAALYKLLYRYLNLNFGVVFKGVILCSTPYVICCLLGTLIDLQFLEIIGNLIMLFYTTKALTNYKIKYDGGIPIPPFMQNMIRPDEKQDKDEKGSGDDEL